MNDTNVFVGIDYHKRYSVISAVDGDGRRLIEARVTGNTPEGFRTKTETGSGRCLLIFNCVGNEKWPWKLDLARRIREKVAAPYRWLADALDFDRPESLRSHLCRERAVKNQQTTAPLTSLHLCRERAIKNQQITV